MVKEWMTAADGGLLWVVAVLLFLLAVLAVMRHELVWRRVRIYNWDGKRYRFLGRERLRKKNDGYVIKMNERQADASYTTRYLLLVSAQFAGKHRYEDLLFLAGEARAWLPVEKRMRVEVLYVYGTTR